MSLVPAGGDGGDPLGELASCATAGRSNNGEDQRSIAPILDASPWSSPAKREHHDAASTEMSRVKCSPTILPFAARTAAHTKQIRRHPRRK